MQAIKTEWVQLSNNGATIRGILLDGLAGQSKAKGRLHTWAYFQRTLNNMVIGLRHTQEGWGLVKREFSLTGCNKMGDILWKANGDQVGSQELLGFII